MRVVLIGASGFFGRYFIRALTADQHHCVVLTRAAVRRNTLDLMAGVDLVQADINEDFNNVKIFTLQQKLILETSDIKLSGNDLDKKYELINLIKKIKKI